MAQFNDENHQTNGHMDPRPTGKAASATSSMVPRSRPPIYVMTNPHAYHGGVPPPASPFNETDHFYSQWMNRGREAESMPRERYDKGPSTSSMGGGGGGGGTRWRHPYYEEVPTSRFSTSLEDYYHTPPYYHHSSGGSGGGHSYHHAPSRAATIPQCGNGYQRPLEGGGGCADIFRSPHRDSYSAPPHDGHILAEAASPPPQMVTPTRAMHPDDVAGFGRTHPAAHPPALPHYSSGPDRRDHNIGAASHNHDGRVPTHYHDGRAPSHYHDGIEDDPRRNTAAPTGGRPTSASSSMIWHLEENDIVCGRGVSSTHVF
jgi:hypothetical protein